MINRRNGLIVAALLLLLFSLGGNGWQYFDSQEKQGTIDSLFNQESELRETLWKNAEQISNLISAKDSLFDLLALSLEKNASDSLKINRFMQDIDLLNRQVDSLKRIAFSGLDPRYRKYYEELLAVEKQKLAIERGHSDSLQAQLKRQYAFSRKLSSDLNQIQDYFDELSSTNLISSFVQFDAKGKPVNIVQNAIGKVSQLQQQLEKSKQLLDSYENESWAISMRSQIANYQKTIDNLNKQIAEYEKILHTGIIASGNRDFLIKHNLLTYKKRALGKNTNDFHPENMKENHPACYKTDTRSRQITVKASGTIVEMFPYRDPTSYRIIKDRQEPNLQKIDILKPQSFWENKNLIIVTD